MQSDPPGVATPVERHDQDEFRLDPLPASTRWSDALLAWADLRRRWLFAALLLIYALGFNGRWRMEPDSALYLSIARNLATGHGYTYHGLPNAVAYPGLPYALSATFRLFPAYHRKPDNLLPESLLVFAAGLATLGLTYRLIRLNAGRPTAVVVACGVGMTRTFYRSALAIMTDMPFLLGVMMFLVGYEGMVCRPAGRRARWADGLLVDVFLMAGGLAVTISTRPAWLAFVPAAAAAVAAAGLRGRVPWKAAAAAVGAAVLGAALFIAADPRKAAGAFRVDRYEDQLLYQFTRGHGAQVAAAARDNAVHILREVATSAMFGLKFGAAVDSPAPRRWYDHLGAAASVASAVVVLGFGLGLFARRALWGLWVVATILMMVLVLPHERYFLEALPLLVFAWWRWLRWVNLRVPGRAGNIVFALLLLLGMVPNTGQVGSVVIEQRRTPFIAHYQGGNYAPLEEAARHIRSAGIPENAVILAPNKTARILTYLSRHTVVEENELLFDVGWPLPDRPVYVLDEPGNRTFQSWLTRLSVTRPRPDRARTPSDNGSNPFVLWRAASLRP